MTIHLMLIQYEILIHYFSLMVKCKMSFPWQKKKRKEYVAFNLKSLRDEKFG